MIVAESVDDAVRVLAQDSVVPVSITAIGPSLIQRLVSTQAHELRHQSALMPAQKVAALTSRFTLTLFTVIVLTTSVGAVAVRTALEHRITAIGTADTTETRATRSARLAVFSRPSLANIVARVGEHVPEESRLATLGFRDSGMLMIEVVTSQPDEIVARFGADRLLSSLQAISRSKRTDETHLRFSGPLR